jgi:hypothetical protein
MKSNSQIIRQPGRPGEETFSSRPRSTQPLTDYHFHAANDRPASGTASNHKLARPVFAPGFRDLSNEFLGAETKRNYVAEVLFFAIIVGVSVWPIVTMVQALALLMK